MTLNKNRYQKQESCGQWIFDGNEFKFKNEIQSYEFDQILRDWVKTTCETKYETCQERGFLKTLDFIIVFPDDSEPAKQFGKKSKKTPTLLMKVGVASVRPEAKHTWLIKKYQKAINQEGASGQNRIYAKILDQNGLTYKFDFIADERISCSVGDEKEVTLTQLKELEAKGAYIIYFGRALYSEEHGFEFGSIALNKNL